MPEEALRRPIAEIESEEEIPFWVIAALAQFNIPELDERRTRMTRAGAGVLRPIRGRLREIGHELQEMVRGWDGRGPLPFQLRRQVVARADELLRPVFAQLEGLLARSAEVTARREAASLLRFLRGRNHPLPPPSEVRSMVRDAIDLTLDDYRARPFYGLTPAQRLEAHRLRAQRRLRQALARGQEAAAIRAGQVLTGTDPTNRIGSVSKDALRLATSERARIAGQLGANLMQNFGLDMAYWRLSAGHVFRGGEPCERLAAATGDGVIAQLELRGFRISRIPLQGLRLISDWPGPPHPNCRCYIEPALFLG